MKHLNGKPAGSSEVEGPGPVHVLGLAGLHSCRPQPIVDGIDLVVRILHEANVKPLRIGDLVRMVEIADSEHETGVIRQYDVSVRRFSDAVESELLLKKVTGSRYIGDGKVNVIQFHGCLHIVTSYTAPAGLAISRCMRRFTQVNSIYRKVNAVYSSVNATILKKCARQTALYWCLAARAHGGHSSQTDQRSQGRGF